MSAVISSKRRLALVWLVPLALGCVPSMEQVAGTEQPVDYSALPGDTNWKSLATPAEILATNQYKPPGLYPCQDNCHKNRPSDPTPRALTGMHADIVFDHDEEHRWCFGCHNPDDRNYLRLADGKLIEFGDHFELCGQCHGDTYRDYRAGIHGKRTGEWNGEKRYWLCGECHNPHAPAFPGLVPMPPPPKTRPGTSNPVVATTAASAAGAEAH